MNGLSFAIGAIVAVIMLLILDDFAAFTGERACIEVTGATECQRLWQPTN